jgi:DNA polymerase
VLITVDFETYYNRIYSLTKLTTEEYIRNPFFEVIGVGVKVGDAPAQWASGTHEELKAWLKQFNWADNVALAHNAMFDGAILNWIFDIRPKYWCDTLCLGRYLHGTEVGGSLQALSSHYNIGVKGAEVINAMGKRRSDFTKEGLAAYQKYCLNDVELCYSLCLAMFSKVPVLERKIIDLTIKMYTEPSLQLDVSLLEQHLQTVQETKQALIDQAGTVTEDLMSNQKFADLLREHGVIPPIKVSPRTGKETLAMSKSDEGFMALLEHPNEQVQALMAARLGVKSTLEETRTETLIGIAHRNAGTLPVPLKYYAAHTGRWGGADNLNLQNLPTRGPYANKIKQAIQAPMGYVLIDADSSQIEARVLAWLAGETDLARDFRDKKDVYKKMASEIYNVPLEQVNASQRQVGKVAILGAGYGMGAAKFQTTLKGFNIQESIEQCNTIIKAYRKAYPKIVAFWGEAQFNLAVLESGKKGSFTTNNIKVLGKEHAFELPDGRLQRYPELTSVKNEESESFMYTHKKTTSKIYGGKVVENICQAVARSIIAEQMVTISKRYQVVLTVHDSIVCLALECERDTAEQYVHESMCQAPDWAQGLSVSCEVAVSRRYGGEAV